MRSPKRLVGKGQHGWTAGREHRRHWGRSRGLDRSARARTDGQEGDDTGSTGEMRRSDPSASVRGVRIPGGRRSRIRPWRGAYNASLAARGGTINDVASGSEMESGDWSVLAARSVRSPHRPPSPGPDGIEVGYDGR